VGLPQTIGGRMSNELNCVKTFHRKFNFIVNEKPTHLTTRLLAERIHCMQEELDEFKSGAKQQDMAEMADALVDLVYFALGTAVMMGLPWDRLFADVQRANMQKVRGMTKRGFVFDACKPVGWVAPLTEHILAESGYNKAVDSLPENHAGYEEDDHG
jgi:predicted HAD superfamily Cof-like phosphohydrolase